MIFILLLFPENDPNDLQRYMKRNGFTRFEELEPRDGTRRFRLY